MFNKRYWTKITNPDILKNRAFDGLVICGFTICGFIEYRFSPQGYTALFLLSESHFAIHTFPEEGKSYLEISSCIEDPFLRFDAFINEFFMDTINDVKTT
jgi:S-adenosylmethionine decarboxylase